MQSQDQMRAEKARWQMETQAWRSRSGRISLSNCLALMSPCGIAQPLTIRRLLSFSIRGSFLCLTTWCSY